MNTPSHPKQTTHPEVNPKDAEQDNLNPELFAACPKDAMEVSEEDAERIMETVEFFTE